MKRLNLIKICCIAGFLFGEIYNVFVMIAPNRPGRTSRMFYPAEWIPKSPDVPPGTPTPPATIAWRIGVGALFLGPFGALAGLGVGVLLEGARQSFSGTGKKRDGAPGQG